MATGVRNVKMLRAELELLIAERRQLLQAAGAAAALVAELDAGALPRTACGAARSLAASLNLLDDETLSEAIVCVRASALAEAPRRAQ